MNKILSFKFSELSLFRNSLMGLGILGVLVAHALAWMKVDAGFIYKILNLFSRLVFVEGFLFLSDKLVNKVSVDEKGFIYYSSYARR